ncbi:MAG: hypothetical protein ACK5PS_19695 [Desulfopila sp.]
MKCEETAEGWRRGCDVDAVLVEANVFHDGHRLAVKILYSKAMGWGEQIFGRGFFEPENVVWQANVAKTAGESGIVLRLCKKNLHSTLL